MHFWRILEMPLVNCKVNLILRWSKDLPEVETKDYNVMIDGKNFFDQPINSMTKTYENIRKTTTGQGDDYKTGCL